MALDKDKKRFLRALDDAGVRWDYTSDGQHIRVYPPNRSHRPFTASLGKGDPKALKNAIMDCRRADIDLDM